MTMTDPIADMLTRVRNANVAMHDSVKMPGSKLKVSLASILEREGYIAGFKTSSDEARPGSVLEIKMKYTEDRTARSPGCGASSTPGVRGLPSRTTFPGSSAAWASPFCRRAKGCSPTGRRASARSAERCSVMSGEHPVTERAR